MKQELRMAGRGNAEGQGRHDEPPARDRPPVLRFLLLFGVLLAAAVGLAVLSVPAASESAPAAVAAGD